jgi:hypothetical protein
MNSDRWKRVEEVYYSMLASPPGSRAAILEQLCPEDQNTRHEVESLLNARDQAGNFLSPEDFQGHVTELAEPDLTGRTLGHYHIVSAVGYRLRNPRSATFAEYAVGHVTRSWATRCS